MIRRYEMIIPVNLEKNSYNITLQRNSLQEVGNLLNLDRKVLIVTDNGVPKKYVETVKKACKDGIIVTIEAGEASKTLKNFEYLCQTMLKENFGRTDCVVAVGGGVVGDLAGFAASCYMRGVDFYNIPTTLLSQVDSSIGGKTAVDLDGIKNIVGAFYQPKAVIIDPEVLKTLDKRQFACGSAEIIKMAATFDSELFKLIEKEEIADILEEAIQGALKIKANVVEQDEREAGLRKALNFGHTLGHGIESVTDLLHGECVALGMLPMCEPYIRERLKKILIREGLSVTCNADSKAVTDAAMHDKKSQGELVVTVQVDTIGTYKFVKCQRDELLKAYQEVFI